MTLLTSLTGVAPAESEIYYPESGGEPSGETDFYITVILYLRQAKNSFCHVTLEWVTGLLCPIP